MEYIIFKESSEYGCEDGEIIGIVETKQVAEYFKKTFGLDHKIVNSTYLKTIYNQKLKIYDIRVNIKDYKDITVQEDFPLEWDSDLINKQIKLRFESCVLVSHNDPRQAYGFEVMAQNKDEAIKIMRENFDKLILKDT